MGPSRKLRFASVAFLLPLVLMGCGDSSGPDPKDEIASVTVAPGQATVDVGSTSQLQATVKNGRGETMTASVTWASSTQTVATVNATGLVTGVAEGACSVTASAGGHSGTAAVTVNDPFPPQQPSNVAAAPVSNSEIAVTWTDNANNEDEFRIDREEVVGGEAGAAGGPEAGPDRVYSQVGTVGPNVTSFSDTGLQSVTTYRYQVLACNQNGCSEPVAGSGNATTFPQLVIQTTDLPGTNVGVAYSQTLSATGGNGSLVWSISAGALPDGLVLDSGFGVVSGTPTAEGTFAFTVQVQSGDGQTVTAQLSIEIVFVFSCSIQSEIPELECQALKTIHEGTNGATWSNSSGWLANLTPCSWKGVTCADGSVSELRLDRNNLMGPLPTQIADFANLERLDLSYNDLSGQVPAQIGTLAQLRYLDLDGNELTGSVPEQLADLSDLVRLDLAGNDLTGSVPPELGGLANLEYMDFEHNDLTGPIPPELGSLSKLEMLGFRYCDLSGTIPSELGNLVNLKKLMLGSNQFTGEIPPSLAALTNLEWFDIAASQLTGGIPSFIGSFNHLIYLSLGNNSLTGTIPPGLGALADLENLFLAGNQLTGEIPPEIGNLANLEWLALDGNQLTGTIPTGLTNLSKLKGLSLGRNQLTGEVPSGLGGLAQLLGLYLASNQLTGTIPSELGNLSNLNTLSMEENQFTGGIPQELGNLSNLERLKLHTNQLSGVIPLAVARLGGQIQQAYGSSRCELLPGNTGLSLPDTQDYRDADLDSDGFICKVPFPPIPLLVTRLW